MTIFPAHTPYDGSAAPFTISLKPLDPATWIEVDGHYGDYLAEKDRLIAERPEAVFAAEPGTEDAQREVFDLVVDHLVRRSPDVFPTRRERDLAMARLAAFPPHASDEPRLQAAARFVQEDLVLMRRSESGWRLVAASLCFPSSWTLAEKFGFPIEDIHAPVPAFGRGTRTATLINRIFDNLKPEQPVWRMNWSLQTDDLLYVPMSSLQRDERADTRPTRFSRGAPLASAFIRVERQTLRRLPASGDILFTIRIHLDPLRILETHPDRRRIASSFAGQLRALDERQLAYKGLTTDRDLLVAVLEEMTGG